MSECKVYAESIGHRSSHPETDGRYLQTVYTGTRAECLRYVRDMVRAEYAQCARAIRDNLRDGWRVVACDVNWEDPDLTCEHSGARIDSAYGETGE